MPSVPPPPLPPPPPPPAPPAVRSANRFVPALAVAIVGVLVVAAVGLVTGVFDDDDGLPHPDRWDPRVAALADFVEDARGLEFEHPVYVDFLTPEEYTAEVTTDEAELEDEDREELDRFAGQLRALGLASGDLDLFADINTVSDDGTLAFYRPDDGRVRVRGTELTVGIRVTLVHELTHALQDQHFDLVGMFDDDLEDGEAEARRALTEGDALRIEDVYIAEALSPSEQAEYDAESDAESEGGLAATDDVPSFLTASFGLPYALGRPFVTMLDARGGNDAVDDAFRDPPSTEEHLFDPVSYLDDEEAITVDLGLDDAIETTEDGTFAPAEWFLLLGDRIDPKQALVAALGWGGSNYAAYEREDRTCIRAVFVGGEERDEDELRNALSTWHTALPDALSTTAQLIEVEGHPGLDACDPGPEVEVTGQDRSLDLLVIPAVHAYLEADAASVLDPDESRCYARAMVDHYSTDDLLEPDEGIFGDPAFQDVAGAAVVDCTAR